MHGGVLYLRADALPEDLPAQVEVVQAEESDLAFLWPHVEAFCRAFSLNVKQVMDHRFYILRPNTHNPYHRLYTQN